jgi:signal transduction histidine kinase
MLKIFGTFSIPGAKPIAFFSLKKNLRVLSLLLPAAWLYSGVRLMANPQAFIRVEPHCFVTNVVQFRSIPSADYLSGCDFRLTGVITLVDTNRNLLVLQDDTGAVALNFKLAAGQFEFGQQVTLCGTNCCPLVTRFPDYPYRPSGGKILDAFEAPANWGTYNLERLRGYLRPTETGDYRFWIASDESSELWLSTDENPANIHQIASVYGFNWTLQRQWNKYATQGSETIHLEAGKTYYIEAIHQQTGDDENLSVGWQKSAPRNSPIKVIDGRFLVPWNGSIDESKQLTNGITYEYWTNYTPINLTGLAGNRPYASMLAVETVAAETKGPGILPAPINIDLSRPLAAEARYRWARIKGNIVFKALTAGAAVLDIADGPALVQARILHWREEDFQKLRQMTNASVQVEGVCDGLYDTSDNLMPGLLWVQGTNNILLTEAAVTNQLNSENGQPAAKVFSSQTIVGYFGTRDVVTFAGQVFGQDLVYVQSENSALQISTDNSLLRDQFQVGYYVDMGGALEQGGLIQKLLPNFVTHLGRHAMPAPLIHPLSLVANGGIEGRWSELEAVVQSVATNGTVRCVSKDGAAHLWLGEVPFAELKRFIDARLRVRGVLNTTLINNPLLLVPSPAFIDIKQPAPDNSFAIPQTPIADVLMKDFKKSWSHRVRVIGEVTYKDNRCFYLQDATGAIQVRSPDPEMVKLGDTVEVVAFPAVNNSGRLLEGPLIRPTQPGNPIEPIEVDLSEALSSKQVGELVRVNAGLLSEKTNGAYQVLELQVRQHILTAILDTRRGGLPDITPGSQLRITGIRGDDLNSELFQEEFATSIQFLAPLNLVLRSPQDVKILSGPPWWTWKRTATLVITLIGTLGVTLLWIHLLHRRLERQQAARLAFARMIFERLEDERRRIAVNLHDSLGQTLLLIKNHAIFANQAPSDTQIIKTRLNEISGTTTQAIDEVRRITHGLRPYQLDRLGLTQAVRTMIQQASDNSHMSFASLVEDIDGLLDKDAEIHVYRIIQESVNNIIKHSAATESTVVVKKRATRISISIRDNGKGFDSAKLTSQPQKQGFGLTGVSERIRILKGTFELDSKPGGGTTLTVEIPFQNNQNLPT